ncbi:serine/threonine-protein kinase [Flavobacterium eburneipallidum]|uniref:serine/threonine-protein kinase n=1 Tax=Flavobacterium eburneipallidum TaxID=3003263 RepID=UPI0022AC7DF6|nr:serine/threonine-protein kinase [Flavobacterium eburneipallidum]
MKTNELNRLSEEDDIILQIEQFKMGLVSLATGGRLEQKEYSTFRKLILSQSNLEKVIPRFLKLCRTSDEFWAWIKSEAPTYAERRVIISEAINPILEILEYETGEGALEFSKNYEEKEIIGNGGFGLVYLYEHRLLQLPFAVKVFAPAFYEGGGKELERFFQEAKMLFKLNHPSIIKVYDAGMIGSRPFIRMEYFNGRNLNQILNDFGTLKQDKALELIKNIVKALNHAHEEIGIIHRDLKPSNIMASMPNQFRIIDFGLSIFIENELHSRFTKTGEGTISGYYNAPELIQNPRLIDKRSDIYSIGAIWYTLLIGQPPAGSSFLDILYENPEISNEYVKCIEGCLKNIENRTKSCTELLDQIEKL